MTRGLIKLSFQGNNDKKLIGNPKICFWKYVYKQHTNYSKQSNNLLYEGGSYMKNNCCSTFRFKIHRNAELANYISLRLKLPKIYSEQGDLGEFMWINNLGANIIESARLYFDDILIEEIDGDYLIAYRDTMLDSDKTCNFNKLIGNVKELYNPLVNDTYPSCGSVKGDLSGDDYYINNDYNTAHSIDEFTLNIPLLFCFFREKSFIPLVSNKLREVFVEVKLRPLSHLYTINKQTKIDLRIPSDPLSLYFMTETEMKQYAINGWIPTHNIDVDIWYNGGGELIGLNTITDQSEYNGRINLEGGVPVNITNETINIDQTLTTQKINTYKPQLITWVIFSESTNSYDIYQLLWKCGDSNNEIRYFINNVYNPEKTIIMPNNLHTTHLNINNVFFHHPTDGSAFSLKDFITVDRTLSNVNDDDYRERVYRYFYLLYTSEFVDNSSPFNYIKGPSGWGLLGGINMSGGAVEDFAGYAVAINNLGNRVALSIPYFDGVYTTNVGLVRVYELNENNIWQQLGGDNMRGIDLSGYTVPGIKLGGVEMKEELGNETSIPDIGSQNISFNSTGDRIAIGSPFFDGNSKQGRVQIYKLNNSNWEIMSISGGGEGPSDYSDELFGYSVSLNGIGNILVIGAPGNNKIYIYECIGDIWVKQKEEVNSSLGINFGWSTAINFTGDIVAVGSPEYNSDSGMVQIYKFNSVASSLTLYESISGDNPGDKLGYSIDLNASGNRIIVGIPNYNVSGIQNTGLVRVYGFEFDEFCVQLGNDNMYLGENDNAGWSVSINNIGDRIVFGSYSDTAFTEKTVAKIYEYNNSEWVQVNNNITASGNYRSGIPVSINDAGNIIITGEYMNGINKNGLVKVYKNRLSGFNFSTTHTEKDYYANTICYNERIVDASKNIFKFTKNIHEQFFIPSLEVEYIFLDNIERKKMAVEKQTQIFAFNKKLVFKDIQGKEKLYINEYHPLKSLRILAKRNDLGNKNLWGNFSNNDYENQDTRYLQNYFTRLAKTEALAGGNSDFIKNLGVFLKKSSQNYTCLIENTQFNIISGYFNLLKGLDFLTSKPKISLKNNAGNSYEIIYDLMLRFIFVTNGGRNYIEKPILLDENDVEIPSRININKGEIISVELDKQIYKNFKNFRIQSQLYCNEVRINNGGFGYISLPYAYMFSGNKYERLIYTGKIENGKLIECKIRQKKVIKNPGQIIIGGSLNSISSKNSNIMDDTSYKFHDPHNKIIEPVISFEDKQIQILDAGAGLSKDTKLCVGRIISEIKVPGNLIITENISDFTIVPRFYNKKKTIDLIHTTKPELDITYKQIAYSDLNYKIQFNDVETNIDNFKLSNDIVDSKILLELDILPNECNKNMFITFKSLHGNKTISIGKSHNIIKVPIKIIKNFEYDITDTFDNVELIHIKEFENYILFSSKNKINNIKLGDSISLFIKDTEISSVRFEEIDNYTVGLGSYCPNYVDIGKYNNKLLFGNFTKGVFELEVGKSIKSVEIPVEHFSNKLTFTNCLNKFSKIEKYVAKKPIKETVNFIKDTIEFDFGGDTRPLHDYVAIELNQGVLSGISFNQKYKFTNYTWHGFKNSPIFILKNNSINMDAMRKTRSERVNEQLRLELEESYIENNSQDALVKGIIDYNGQGIITQIINKNSGFGGEIELVKQSGNLYQVRINDKGFNYDEDLLCSLISYKIFNNKLLEVDIIEQFEININDIGQIDTKEGILWKNGQPITEFKIVWDKSHNSDNHNILNPNHNRDTCYKLILGNIPAKESIIINQGGGYLGGSDKLKYKLLNKKPLLFTPEIDYYSNIEAGCLKSLSLTVYKTNNYKTPLISYRINNGQLILVKDDYILEPIRQLTGFHILDKGLNITKNSYLYNGFITKFPKPKKNIKNVFIEYNNTKIPLIIRENEFTVPNKSKFNVYTSSNSYIFSNYKNINTQTSYTKYKMQENYIGSQLILGYIDRCDNILLEFNEINNYTKYSKITPYTIIDKIDIIYPGNELDASFSEYKLVFTNNNQDIIETSEYLPIGFSGKNNITKGNIYDITINGCGMGYGAAVSPIFVEAGGCELLPITKFNECFNENCGSEYAGKDTTLTIENSVGDHLCSNAYGWSVVNESQLIDKTESFDLDEIKNFINIWRYRDQMKIPILDKNNYQFYLKSNPITELGLSIDFKVRESIRDAEYYRLLEKHFKTSNSVNSNILLYSFCLNNDKFQPTGSLNLSSIDNLCLNINTLKPFEDTQGGETYKYDICVFLSYYNAIDYINGQGGLRYGN